jgi:hypothetical protein
MQEKEKSMMIRFLLGSIVCSFVLYPQVISCATSKKADNTVELDRPLPSSSSRFERVLMFEIEYGKDAETTLGFQPGGDEKEKMAPNAFEVEAEGSILVSDPVHRKNYKLKRNRDGQVTLQNVGPYSFSNLPGKAKNNADKTVRVLKTGAETADIVFADGDPSRTVRLKIDGPLASIKLIGVRTGGEAVVLVSRFKELGSMDVEREILLVHSTGETKARLKVDGAAFAPPVVEFQLAPDGSLYRMIPGDESVTFVRWEVR